MRETETNCSKPVAVLGLAHSASLRFLGLTVAQAKGLFQLAIVSSAVGAIEVLKFIEIKIFQRMLH